MLLDFIQRFDNYQLYFVEVNSQGGNFAVVETFLELEEN